MNEFIIISVTVIASAFVIIGLALTVHWGNGRDTGIMPYFFYLNLFLYALATILSTRNLSLPGVEMSAIPEAKSTEIVWLGRFCSLYVLFAFSERFLHRFFLQSNSPHKKTEFPQLLLWGVTLYFLTNIISPAMFSSHPIFSHEYFYPFILCCAAVIMSPNEVSLSVTSIRNALALFLLAGLCFLVIKPSLVLNPNYHGLIPFLNIRLAGLANHANGLGALSALFLLLLWKHPFSNRYLSALFWITGSISLLLSQSKTSWIALILCAASSYYFTYGYRIKEHFLNYKNPHFSGILLGSTLLICFMFGVITMFTDLPDTLSGFFNSQTGSTLTSFSGRDIIWDIALEEWHKNPIFGYGVTIWDQAFRTSIQLDNATSAHNQFYQSLSSAGLIGVAGLVIYGLILFYFSLLTAKKSAGLSLALFLLIITGCFSESSLTMDALGRESLPHVLLLMILATTYERRKPFASTLAESREIIIKGVA